MIMGSFPVTDNVLEESNEKDCKGFNDKANIVIRPQWEAIKAFGLAITRTEQDEIEFQKLVGNFAI